MSVTTTDLGILLLAFAAGLLVTATHVPLGIQVLGRDIVFIDLAIAQVAGLGVIFAAWLGLEAEPVEASYTEVERLVRAAGPAMLRLPGVGAPRFLALLSGRQRRVAILGPDLVMHRLVEDGVRVVHLPVAEHVHDGTGRARAGPAGRCRPSVGPRARHCAASVGERAVAAAFAAYGRASSIVCQASSSRAVETNHASKALGGG